MKILYYTSCITDSLPHGEGLIAYNLSSHITEMTSNIELDIYTPFFKITDRDFLEKVNIYEISSNHPINRPAYSSQFSYLAYKLSKRKRYDLIFQNQAISTYFTLFSKVPVISRIDLLWPYQKYGFSKETIRAISRTPLEGLYSSPFLLQKAIRKKTRIDVLIAISKKIIEQPPEHIEHKRIRYIPNGVDTEFFKPSAKSKNQRPTILFVGNIVRAKGLHNLLYALTQIRKEVPDINLFVVGEGSDKEFYIALAEKLNLRDSVVFLGFVQKHRLPKVYSQADVFCCPSEGEPFGMVNLEAMACGTPVVGFKAGGLPDYIDETVGLLVSPYKYMELAKAILFLLQDRKLRRQMGRSARKRVEINFDWRVVAKETARVFDEAMSLVR